MRLELFDYEGNREIILRSSTISDIKGEAHTIKYSQEINTEQELSFILPLYIYDDIDTGLFEENVRWDYIQTQKLIKYIKDDSSYQWFKIKTVDDMRDDSGKLTSNVQCKHISYDLNKKGLDKEFEQTGNALTLMTLVLANTGWSVGVVDTFTKDSVEKIRTLKIENQTNTLSHLQDLAELFEGFLRFNSDKTVDLKIEIGSNNGVSFRYKKNLKQIKRTVTTDDLITRMYAQGGNDDLGLVAINGVNPTKQSYVDDFTYYITSGMMPLSIQALIPTYTLDITTVNTNINNTQTSIDTTTTSLNTSTTYLAETQLEINARNGSITNINDKLLTETDATTRSALNAQKTALQTRVNHLTNGYTFTPTGNVTTTSSSNIVNGSGTLFLTELFINDQIIIGSVTKRIIAIVSNTQLKTDSVYTSGSTGVSFTSTVVGVTALNASISTYNSTLTTLNGNLTTYQTTKNNLENAYKSDLQDFIHEGLYSDSNIIAAQALYDNTVDYLAKLCYPKVSYTISIVDLSNLTGWEIDKFQMGDIVNVYDEILKVNIAARIRKVDRTLDDPLKVDVEIANFISSYESLFRNISKSVDAISQKQEYWNRTVNTINSDGSFEAGILQSTFDKNLMIISSGTNNSVTNDANGITVADLSSGQNDSGTYKKMVRINGGIIAITSNYGSTWNTAMTADGLNFKYAIGGTLDVGQINIYGGASNTKFNWNSTGLFAINPSNANQWIRFNQNGLYATLDNGSTSVFDLSWSGLTINGYTKLDTFYNQVKISSTNGIQVFDASSNEVIKIGQLTSSPNTYGIKVSSEDGSKTIMDNTGFYRLITSSANTYKYRALDEAGSGTTPFAGADYYTSEQTDAYLDSIGCGILWVTIANTDFGTGSFVAVPSFKGMIGVNAYFVSRMNITIDVLEYDFTNRKFKIRARVMSYREDNGRYFYYGASFSYYAYSTS